MEQKQLENICNDLYELCLKALAKGELPIASIIIDDKGKTFKSINNVEKNNNPLEHSEIRLINKVMKKNNVKYLHNMTLICSLEPCLMCFGAILKSEITNVFYLTSNEKEGALSFYNTFINKNINIQQIKDKRFDELLINSFKEIRDKEKKV